MFYKLEGKKAVGCTREEWSTRLGRDNKVARTVVGTFHVSTVFLRLNHNFKEDDRPLLFETMIFDVMDAKYEALEYQWRYSTWEEAEAHHKVVVETLRSGGSLREI